MIKASFLGIFNEKSKMKARVLVSCCSARVFYDLGGAHEVEDFSCQEEFDIDTEKKTPLAINICVTNEEQIKARVYLRCQGWDEQKFGNLILHTISGNDLARYLTYARRQRKERARITKVC